MKKINEFIKIVILCIAVSVGMVTFSHVTVKAEKLKLTYAKRIDSDNKVTLYVKGIKKLNKKYRTFICYDYTSNDGNNNSSKELKVKFKKSGANGYKYTLKLKKKGIYNISVNYVSDNGSIDDFTKGIRIIYDDSKPQFSLKNLPEINMPKGTYKKYFKFLGNAKREGNTYYYKDKSVIISVIVYCGSVDLDKLICKTGNAINKKCNVKVINQGKGKGFVEEQFTFNGEIEGQVSFTAINELGVKNSISTGKTLIIDTVKPKVKIYKGFDAKNKTVYHNKSVLVPIKITEKHFDSTRTKVLVDGKRVNVLWNSSGVKNTANVKIDQGEHIVSVIGIDKAGNASDEVKSAKIVIDTVEPTVKINGIANGKSYGNKWGEYVPYMISVEIADKYLAESQRVTLCRITEKSNKILERVKLSGSKSRNAYKVTSSDIKTDGYYRLEIIAKDKAGNKVNAKSLSNQGNFQIKKGRVFGYFYINRNGSKYEIDKNSKKYFGSVVKKSDDIVIYEYNINEIKKANQKITLITTLGDRELKLDYDYLWENVSDLKANNAYPNVYKYTVKSENFNEGPYSIKIISSTEVVGDGNNSLKVDASSEDIMNDVINIDTKAPEVISMEAQGRFIYIHIRDNNLKKDSVELKVSGKKIKIELDKDMSTSTNYYFTAEKGNGLSQVELKCSDYAGNETISNELQVNEEKASLVFIVIVVISIMIILITIIIIIRIKRKR